MSKLDFVRKLNRSLNTKKIQRVVDSSPLILYYTVSGMTAEAYTELKQRLHPLGFECHMMCRNKCLPVHEDDMKRLRQNPDSIPAKQKTAFVND